MDRTAMTDDRNERRISDALSSLREGIEVPPVDPEREQALLAAFDADWSQPRLGSGRWVWRATAAALIAIAVGLNWIVLTQPPRSGEETADAVADSAGFVPWPGSDAWPPFESGELIRVDLPVSALPALGLWPPSSAAGVVQADIVVGQDGFARAVRLVQ
jgi:hypothetical protein